MNAFVFLEQAGGFSFITFRGGTSSLEVTYFNEVCFFVIGLQLASSSAYRYKEDCIRRIMACCTSQKENQKLLTTSERRSSSADIVEKKSRITAVTGRPGKGKQGD